jgi:hypothetical protein
VPAIEVPDPLPPAITLPREVIEFAVSQHLEEFSESSLVARTWRWVLHGGWTRPDQPHGLVRVRRQRAAIKTDTGRREHRRSAVVACPRLMG